MVLDGFVGNDVIDDEWDNGLVVIDCDFDLLEYVMGFVGIVVRMSKKIFEFSILVTILSAYSCPGLMPKMSIQNDMPFSLSASVSCRTTLLSMTPSLIFPLWK